MPVLGGKHDGLRLTETGAPSAPSPDRHAAGITLPPANPTSHGAEQLMSVFHRFLSLAPLQFSLSYSVKLMLEPPPMLDRKPSTLRPPRFRRSHRTHLGVPARTWERSQIRRKSQSGRSGRNPVFTHSNASFVTFEQEFSRGTGLTLERSSRTATFFA